MIQSMTGYGRSEVLLEGGKLIIEIRSVNAKTAEISLKTPLIPKDKEMPLRKKLADRLQRGTIDVFITWEPNAGSSSRTINRDLALEYYRQIAELGDAVGAANLPLQEPNYLLATLLRMPDVLDTAKRDVITQDNWPKVEKAFDEALEAIVAYRRHEGEALYKDVRGRVEAILELENEVESCEAERIATVRERLLKTAEDVGVKLDPERFEQEMIFYLEKYDINEEKVRLRQHCRYFFDTIDNEEYPGKKLGFIIQEMGREINTTGSKANHARIQKAVVKMKDELEKIREQSMNIL
ncbi:MAG: YicC family protein [Bacteroidales bacterium]|nr:YicC family protein [Bacteroidales bacterium]